MPWMTAIGATFLVSLISLIGVVTLSLQTKLLKKITFYLVAFSSGTLLGGAFLHLIPEAFAESGSEDIFVLVLVGFSLFFLLERFLHWHHCHKHGTDKCDVKQFAYLNLIGDGVHNFIDGLVIAAAFAVDMQVGFATVLAVMAHEIPQEISDFGVLVYSGMTKTRALVLNFASALIAILGAVAGLFIAESVEQFIPIVLAIMAGGFVYIGASDLIPELHKNTERQKSTLSFIIFVLGIIFMWFLKFWFEH